ncbi:MAG: hypothetical protein ACPGU1_12930 [Myxococcota bacterium]
MLNTAAPYIQTEYSMGSVNAARKLPLHTRFTLFLLVLWTVSQIIAAVPALPDGLRAVLVRSKVLIGPMALGLIAMTHFKALQLKPAFRMLGMFVAYSVFSLLVRSEPNWERASMISAWATCFVVIPISLSTSHRIREFVRLSFSTMFMASIFAIAVALWAGDVSESGGGRTRFHFGMNPNYFAVISATLSYAGFIALLLAPSISRTLCWVAIIGGLVLTFLTDCRTQLLMLGVSFAIYGAYSHRQLIAGFCRLVLVTGTLALSAFMMLIATPIFTIEQTNEISSGRVLLWYSLIKSNLGSGELIPLLWGQSNITLDTGMAGWRKLTHMRFDAFDRNTETTALFQRVAFDNAYLDTLLMTGMIGLILALLGWWHWWKALRPAPSDPIDVRQAKGIARGILGGMLVTGLFASSWPAIGNVSISFSMVLAIALTTVARGAESPPVVVSHARETWNPPGRIR